MHEVSVQSSLSFFSLYPPGRRRRGSPRIERREEEEVQTQGREEKGGRGGMEWVPVCPPAFFTADML